MRPWSLLLGAVIVMGVLRLGGTLHWSWGWITAPLWVPAIGLLGAACVGLGFGVYYVWLRPPR